MIYKTGRTKKITDTIELCDESGNVEKALVISLDIDTIALQLSSKYSDYVASSRRLKEAQNSGDKTKFISIAAVYYQTLIDLFEMVFGRENTEAILEFYEHRYLEMAQQLLPYVYMEVLPKIRKSVKQQKNSIKNIFKSKI